MGAVSILDLENITGADVLVGVGCAVLLVIAPITVNSFPFHHSEGDYAERFSLSLHAKDLFGKTVAVIGFKGCKYPLLDRFWKCGTVLIPLIENLCVVVNQAVFVNIFDRYVMKAGLSRKSNTSTGSCISGYGPHIGIRAACRPVAPVQPDLHVGCVRNPRRYLDVAFLSAVTNGIKQRFIVSPGQRRTG